MDEVIWVRAADLRMPTSRPAVDLGKLVRQFRQFGREMGGMPPLEVTRCAGGDLVINSGVTRAARAYRYAGSDAVVPVIVIEERPGIDAGKLPRVSDDR